MDIEQIALLAGILFILIAVVGGGFTLRELKIPRVPGWGRTVSLIVGLLFVAPFFYTRIIQSPPSPDASDAQGTLATVYADDEPDLSRHDLKLTKLIARAPHDPPRVNDRLSIEFALRNVAEQPIAFSETFVAARSPTEENRDFGYSHQGLKLEPNQAISIKANIIVNAAGSWVFWPCYIISNGSDDEESYCPARWRSFPLRVVE